MQRHPTAQKNSLHTGRATTTAPLTGNLHHLAFDDFPNLKFHHLKHTLGCAIEFFLLDLILATYLSIRSTSSELREFILGSNVCIYKTYWIIFVYPYLYIVFATFVPCYFGGSSFVLFFIFKIVSRRANPGRANVKQTVIGLPAARCSRDFRQILLRFANPKYCNCNRNWRLGDHASWSSWNLWKLIRSLGLPNIVLSIHWLGTLRSIYSSACFFCFETR